MVRMIIGYFVSGLFAHSTLKNMCIMVFYPKRLRLDTLHVAHFLLIEFTYALPP